MLDDELLTDHGVDIRALWRGENARRLVGGVNLQPLRRLRSLSPKGSSGLKIFGFRAPRRDGDFVAWAEHRGRDVQLLAVHAKVTVRYKLTRLITRTRVPDPINDIVESHLQQLKQVFAGHTRTPFRFFKDALELVLKNAVYAAHLLLLTKL